MIFPSIRKVASHLFEIKTQKISETSKKTKKSDDQFVSRQEDLLYRSSTATTGSSVSKICASEICLQQVIPQKKTAVIMAPIMSPVEYTEAVKTNRNRIRQAIDEGGTVDEITTSLNQVISESAWPFEALILRAITHRISGNLRGCIDDCDQILLLDSNNRFAILHQAAALHSNISLYSLSKLQKVNQRAISYSSDHPEDRFATLVACLSLNFQSQHSKAEQLLKNLVQVKPDDVCALSLLMATYNEWSVSVSRINRLDEAIACALKILECNPQNKEATLLVEYHQKKHTPNFL